MRWRRGSNRDVIDVRGRRSGGFPGGGRVAVPGGLGLGGVVIFLLVSLLGGGSGAAFDVPSGFGGGAAPPDGGAIPASQDPERDLRDFSAYVFNDAQDAWAETFQKEGRNYRRAQLVLYRQGVDTGCGSASSAVGPFYCPADGRVYLDLSFYRDMSDELGADGDFAWAYVIAHEMGHHVQRELGTSDEVHRLERENPDARNALSVRLELQADCYAGVWADRVYEAGDLDRTDLPEAIRASQAVGDDRLQRRAGGEVNPDSFTHGTSEQRARWFETGRKAGEGSACDTFSPDDV